ncbi:MAG: MAPEG family protein [Pseudanabaenaceae cyanobacterium bins.68]|nr:MAPEG family protein [Pseudanabaenaceae cyanobacterium bins.68]
MNILLNANQFPLLGIAIAAGLVYLPYVLVAYARLTSNFDFAAPRAMFDRLPDYAKRATWAHQNSFEVFMLFAAAALMVFSTAKATDYTTQVIICFLASRVTYSLFYILNVPILRALSWAVSMGCVASLMGTSLVGIGLIPQN